MAEFCQGYDPVGCFSWSALWLVVSLWDVMITCCHGDHGPTWQASVQFSPPCDITPGTSVGHQDFFPSWCPCFRIQGFPNKMESILNLLPFPFTDEYDDKQPLTSKEEEERRIAEMGRPILGEHTRLEVIIEESYEFKVCLSALPSRKAGPISGPRQFIVLVCAVWSIQREELAHWRRDHQSRSGIRELVGNQQIL